MQSSASPVRKNRKKSESSLLVFLFGLIFSLDRLSKASVVWYFHEGGSLSLWPGVFGLTRVNNTGAAFGILKTQSALLVILSVVFLLFFLWAWFFRSKNIRWPWIFVAAGAAGNLVDRLRYGYVVDFLDFKIWPVFNFADAAICIGVLYLVWGYFKACIRPSSK